MNIFGVAVEAVYGLILMVIVAAFVLGWKPKFSPKKFQLISGILIVSNLVLLAILKEQGMYNRTFAYLLVPLFLIGIGYKPFSNKLMVFLAGWMWLCLELGVVYSNYVTMLSLAVILIPAFQYWRNSKEEGFIRTKTADWRLMLNVFFFFLISTFLVAAAGWESVMVAQYPGKLKWIPLISIIPFFLVKAIPEELVFRGIFQGTLKDKFGFIPALIGASMIYGIAAINNPAVWAFPNWHAMVNALVLGLVCGFVYNKTKSLAVSGALNASVSFLWWMLFANGGH
ncbi:MAG: type II CAAX endopeptidase family protein [bacterium]|nr:type II CAAX endopeptidase family protein [bacterium]